MTYNLSVINNASTIAAYPLAVNEWTGNQFGLYIPLAFFIILLLVWRNEDIKTAFLGASLVATFISILEFLFGLLPIQFVTGFAAVSVFVAIFVLIFTRN